MRHSGLAIAFWLFVCAAARAGDGLTIPHGAELIFELGADGVQIYSCEAKDGHFSWTFTEPEAALFDVHGRQIGTHGRGPTWTFFDGSSVVGDVTGKEPAPQKDNIPWLLLTVKSHVGSGKSSNVAFIRRVDTRGGVPPADGCDATHNGEVARMRYSATYQFFAK
jgi:hypothetical protein